MGAQRLEEAGGRPPLLQEEGGTRAAAAETQGPQRPLRLAIFNSVDFHTHVVAGALQVLRPLSSAPVHVYVTAATLAGRWGFMDFVAGAHSVAWRDCADYEQQPRGAYDLVWFISPEWDVQLTARVAAHWAPAVPLYYVHNAHMPDKDFAALEALQQGSSPRLPLLGMAPHVSAYVARRQQERRRQGAEPGGAEADQAPPPPPAEWLLPTYPYEPPGTSLDEGHQQQQGQQQQQQHKQGPLSGFSVTGSLDKSLRNYGRMWEQVAAARRQAAAAGGLPASFRLNVLGEAVDSFVVPAEVRDLVSVHATPPDVEFYSVVWRSLGLIPALALPEYLTCKLTSAVITSLMTGVPLVADSQFLDAYRVFGPDAVHLQGPGEDELDVMLRVAAAPAEDVWATRAAVRRLRMRMNARCCGLLLGWLLDAGLEPDAASGVARIL